MPAAAAVVGAVVLAMRDRLLAWVLVLAPILYMVFMAMQGRWFGRWLLPVFPMVVVLAAFGGVVVARAVAGRLGRPSAAFLVGAAVLLCVQSAVHVVHMDRAMGRTDTRTSASEWIRGNVPAGSRILNRGIMLFPAIDEDRPTPGIQSTWRPISTRDFLANRGIVHPEDLLNRDIAEFLYPGVVDLLEGNGICWVAVSSLFSDRAVADAVLVPDGVAFYEELARRGEIAFEASGYRPGVAPVDFSFEFSTNLYPFAYERPGGEVVIYHLTGGKCAAGPSQVGQSTG